MVISFVFRTMRSLSDLPNNSSPISCMFVTGVTQLSVSGSDCVAAYGGKMYELERMLNF